MVVFPGAAPAVLVEMGRWCTFVMLDIIGSSGFSYEFRTLGSPSINDSSNTEAKPGSELAGAYTTIFNMRSPSPIVAILSMIFLSYFVQSPLVK